MVIPHERRVTGQHARRVASRTGLIRASYPQPCGPTLGASSKIASGDFVGAQAQNTSLRALPMTVGIGRGSRLVSEPVRPKRGSCEYMRWVPKINISAPLSRMCAARTIDRLTYSNTGAICA